MANMNATWTEQMGNVSVSTKLAALDILSHTVDSKHPCKQLWGYNPDSVPEHSSGLAVDFMVYDDKVLGGRIADFAWQNRQRLGVRWIIWQQQIRSTTPGKSGEWEPMEDRGDDTKNHRDHVHIFFNGNYIPEKPVATGTEPFSLYVLSKGVNNPKTFNGNVKLVQEMLNNVWTADDELDETGRWNKETKDRYKAWQQHLGFTGKDADGVPGRKSLTALLKRDGRFHFVR